MAKILGWSVNSFDLAERVAAQMSVGVLTPSQHQQAFWLANGIAAREKFRSKITVGKFDGFVSEAQVAAREGRFHVLNAIEPNLAAATAFAVRNFLEPQAFVYPHDKMPDLNAISKNRKHWADFLGQLCHIERDPLARGADALLGHYSGFIEGLNIGSLVLKYPFESPDVPLHVLISGAVDVVRSILKERDLIDELFEPVYREHYLINDVMIPPADELAELVDWFEAILNDLPPDGRRDRHLIAKLGEQGYLDSLSQGETPEFLVKMKELFSYLATSGTSRDTRSKASQVMVMLNADPALSLYRKRAATPLGTWQEDSDIAKLDVTDRSAVLTFLKSRAPSYWDQRRHPGMIASVLGSFANNPRVAKIFRRLSTQVLTTFDALATTWEKLQRAPATTLTDKQVDEILWQLWQTARKHREQARFIISDIDHFAIDIKSLLVMVLGNDFARPMPLMVSYLAWAIENHKSVAFATQATDARVAGLTNHPDLGLVRIALTLRDRSDPPTTAQEILEFADGTYTTLARQDERVLRKFRSATCDWSKFSKPEQIQISLTLTNNYRYFARGNKSQVSDSKMVLLDDSMTKVQHYVAAGGRGGLVTGASYKFHPRIIHESVDLLLAATTSGERIIIDLRRSRDPSFLTAFASGGVFVYHDTEVLARAHTKASRDLATLRNELLDELAIEGLRRKILREAKAVLTEAMKAVRILSIAADPATGNLFLVDEFNQPYRPGQVPKKRGKAKW